MAKVLVVDDDRPTREMILTVLLRAGHQVSGYAYPHDAYAAAHDEMPHVILLDDGLPGMTGGELCQRLKESDGTRYIPVVLISAGNRILDPTYIVDVGASAALPKPCRLADLLETIQSLSQAATS